MSPSTISTRLSRLAVYFLHSASFGVDRLVHGEFRRHVVLAHGVAPFRQ